jgi:flagellar hook-associated protein 1 FlgK
LNTLAQSLAQSFNEVHETGYTIPIGAGASLTGIQFFDVPAGGYAAITAGNIALSAEVLADGSNIAASDAPIDLNAEDTGIGNYKIAQKLYELTTSKTIAGIGSFDDFLTSFVVQVGIACSSAQDMSESQTAIVDNLETRRESISGVSIDDEMINILSFQHSYAAAARVLTAIDEAIGILINNTGRVGL